MALKKGTSLKLSRDNASRADALRSFFLCCFFSLVLITVDMMYPDFVAFSALRSAFATVTQPFLALGATITAPFKGLSNVAANLTASEGSLTELEAENALLEALNAELEESAQEAERLRELLELSDAYNLQATGARVIARSTDAWQDTITIDKGSSSGLSAGMAVTSSAGLVGQIIECNLTSSVVRLISDASSSVSAMIQSSRIQGMLEGSITGELTLTQVSTVNTVAVGDVVVSSGLGGVYPKGLPIGRVIEVQSDSSSLELEIVVSPYAGSGSYEEVLVISSLTEEDLAYGDEVVFFESQ